jgi:predicted anti-sigma-YlaC factor YlaD
MSHLPYETWLLDETDLSPQDEAALQAHLQTCAQCRLVKTGWEAARSRLKSVRMVSPEPGFSQRFNATLAARRARQAHQRQIRLLILGLSLGVIASAGLLVFFIFSASSPVGLLVRATGIITGTVSWWNQASRLLIAGLQQPLILLVWILLTSGLCLTAFGWLFTLWRISSKGAHQ